MDKELSEYYWKKCEETGIRFGLREPGFTSKEQIDRAFKIARQAFIDYFSEDYHDDDAVTAKAAPVIHGYWEAHRACSVCGHDLSSWAGAYTGEENYCPRCEIEE